MLAARAALHVARKPPAQALSTFSRVKGFFSNNKKTEKDEVLELEGNSEWSTEDVPTLDELAQFLEPIAVSDLKADPENWQAAAFAENDLATKFKILTACIDRFGKDIPSSELVYMRTMGDVVHFYQTVPPEPQYIELRPQSLPLNMKMVMDNVKKFS